jgi:hypothetical protein
LAKEAVGAKEAKGSPFTLLLVLAYRTKLNKCTSSFHRRRKTDFLNLHRPCLHAAKATRHPTSTKEVVSTKGVVSIKVVASTSMGIAAVVGNRYRT